jgi:ABC-type ATPase with predicted acetyltransferase domain
MPSFDIIRKVNPKQMFRIASVTGTYDLQTTNITEHFSGTINLPETWNVGLIVGRSGTGKTTIARELFGDYIVNGFEWTHECLLDDFPKDIPMEKIYQALNSVGFSSPPSWLKPFDVLSNGEKMRVELARAMFENKDMFVFDEFTSVVDRNIACIGSRAMQKAIRRADKKFIAVTCHYDVEDWLLPDWVFNTDTMTFTAYSADDLKKKEKASNCSSSKSAEQARKNAFGRCLGSITI